MRRSEKEIKRQCQKERHREREIVTNREPKRKKVRERERM